MLVLTRNAGESIIIGNTIKITNLGMNKRGQVKLGIEAPQSISVHREEIYKKIMDNLNNPEKTGE